MQLVTPGAGDGGLMCLAPSKLENGTVIGCRDCWQCKRRKVDDWAGRCIAESLTSAFSYFVTLTYGGDEYGDSGHIKAAVLTYSDVQKYFKRLRKKFSFRYLVAGEYGKKTGRAHWHICLFADQAIYPNVTVEGRRFNDDTWREGFIHVKKFLPQMAYYAVKYVVKDALDITSGSLYQMSRKPPLGHEYFRRLAQRYVDARLAPQDLKYTLEIPGKNRPQMKEFMMTGVTAENFLNCYIERWQARYGRRVHTLEEFKFPGLVDRSAGPLDGVWMPPSDLLDEHVDALYRRMAEEAEEWRDACFSKAERIVYEQETAEIALGRAAQAFARRGVG